MKKMKIVPTTERWNEGERDWSYVEDCRADLMRWEGEVGLKLPAEYREFMLRYNGGRVHPRMFIHTIPIEAIPSASNKTYVNVIYRWRIVESHWKGTTYGMGVPPQHIVFGGTPGAIQLLMSLNPNDYGKIFAWVHSTNIWGTDNNDRAYFQSDGFHSFLRSLFDDEDGSDYKSWRTPTYDRLAKELEV